MNVHRLSNGVRVVADPVAGLETLSLAVVVRGGARWEDEARAGWSHLLEHMVFKGAGSRDAQGLAEAVEAEGGNVNAATGHERTSFQVRTLRDGLPLAVEVTADLLYRPWMDAEELEREKGVVGQEIAEAFDTPDDWVFELAQGASFPGQALGRPVLGTVESLARADRTALDAWRAALYAPERVVVAASGAVDEDRLLRLAEAAFGGAPPAESPPEPAAAAFEGGSATLARRIEQANVVWQLPGVGARDPDYYAFRVFAELLGGGMASRLFQDARERRGLAYSIDAWADPYDDTGVLGIYAGCAAKDAAPLSRLVADNVRSLAEGPGEAELARAKAQLKASLFMAEESTLARAERVAGQALLFDRVLPTDEVRAGVEAVTAADVRRVGERALVLRKAAVAVLGPKAAFGAVEAFAL